MRYLSQLPFFVALAILICAVRYRAEASRGTTHQANRQLSQMNFVDPFLPSWDSLSKNPNPQWLLHNPVVTAPIIGPRAVEQLKENRQAPEITLSEETLTQLDEIFPGPGGEAPKAYAW